MSLLLGLTTATCIENTKQTLTLIPSVLPDKILKKLIAKPEPESLRN
jgi:hypothetical protein